MHSDRYHSRPLVLLLICPLLVLYFSCAPTGEIMVGEKTTILSDSSDVAALFSASSEWTDKIIGEMTLEEKIAQMITVRAFGYFLSDSSEQFRQLEREVRDLGVGGIALFQGDIHTAAVMLNRLQRTAKIPLLVSSDFEWGAAMRLRRTTRFPEAMALGAARDTSLAFEMGKAVAEEARAIGIHQVYAPVADVNVNPGNPVINIRSFGENPELVAGLAASFAEGLQSGGVVATAKHFPGHGDTDIDSHFGLPVISHDRSRLDSVELFPFRRLVERGVASAMIAHVTLPLIQNSKSPIPGSLSAEVVGGLLKKELGFNGLVVTDALEMDAVAKRFGPDSAALLAIMAGNDILLLPPDPERVIRAVAGSVRAGQISEERIDHSVNKILKIKQWCGLDEERIVDVEKIGFVVGSPGHIASAKKIARASMTLLQNSDVLPLKSGGGRKILNILVGDTDDYRTEVHRQGASFLNERMGDYFSAQLRSRKGNFQTLRLIPSTNQAAADSIIKKASEADVIIVPVYSKFRSSSAGQSLPGNITDVLNRILGLGKPTVLLSFGNPYALKPFTQAPACLFAYSDAECSVEAAAEVLFGEIRAEGRIPVTIPGFCNYGDGIGPEQPLLLRGTPESAGFDPDLLAKVDSILIGAIADSAFPGAQIAVARESILAECNSFGKLTYSDAEGPAGDKTMYDIASLTKVVATTAAVMRLCDEGKIALDNQVINYIPEFGNRGKENITVRNLLLHEGGLPAFKRLYLSCKSPAEVIDSVYRTEMIYRTGDSTVYSDLDFIVLGKIVEVVSGAALDKYVDSVFYRPLGMKSTMFNPPGAIWQNIAPTEIDSVLRMGLVRGTVHDENAFVLGGVAGHAGLFSTAADLAVYMQMILNGGSYGGRRYFKNETVRLFTSKQNTKSGRALGWDTKTVNGYSSAGTLFGGRSFGHTGFTGTSIWAEPEKKIFIILLTNRVNPTRNNVKIAKIRPEVHDAVIKALNR